LAILIGGSLLAIIVALAIKLTQRNSGRVDLAPADATLMESEQQHRDVWRMPPLDQLSPARLTTLNRVWLIVLRAYLIVAAGLVIVRIVALAMGS